MKRYLGFAEGMYVGQAKTTAPGGMKFMDWTRAEKICLENPDSTIEAGLMEDWGYTSGLIFDNGVFIKDSYVYDQSRWATPILDVDGTEIECWTHEPHEHTGIPGWWGRS